MHPLKDELHARPNDLSAPTIELDREPPWERKHSERTYLQHIETQCCAMTINRITSVLMWIFMSESCFLKENYPVRKQPRTTALANPTRKDMFVIPKSFWETLRKIIKPKEVVLDTLMFHMVTQWGLVSHIWGAEHHLCVNEWGMQ